jgi:hypothetical protein
MTAAVFALLGAFLSAVICVSVTPLREWTQEVAICRGAERVERDTVPGGDTTGRAPGGGTRPQATEVFEMVCYYAGGTRAKTIGNDRAVLGGVGVSLLLGALLGALVVPASRLRRSRSG